MKHAIPNKNPDFYNEKWLWFHNHVIKSFYNSMLDIEKPNKSGLYSSSSDSEDNGYVATYNDRPCSCLCHCSWPNLKCKKCKHI